MLSTVRQVGSVIGTAAVGALLRNRLVSPLSSQAAIRSAGLPTPVRGTFIGGYRQAAATGLLNGSPAGSGAQPGIPGALAARLHRLAAEGVHPGLRARDAGDHGHARRRDGPGRG